MIPYLDASCTNVDCCHTYVINIRLICMLIILNPKFLHRLGFKMEELVLIASLSFQFWLIRLIGFNNRIPNLILDQRTISKTDRQKHNRKYGAFNTWHIFITVCKLKLQKFRKTKNDKYTQVFFLTSIITQESIHKSRISIIKPKYSKLIESKQTPTVQKIMIKNKMKYTRVYDDLYLNPCNGHG